ncbi:hypothetical protein A0J48_022105 [Sphaerospermopsis aphanizomenoides BCCUSP55]|uniref:hypothetical protein n=1 Tax=Sphaerospermopsis aphanizomenoides TaxID=459663 RepID=UPI0019055B14|nr:hypothetical protein [Sphaerospermopsis aphanizomenoides]MBK1990185.1 hypothetical protein [Sphaerospermopsis aphanizomenoides BCCUSP55]
MSAYQRTILAFVQVIESEPALFSPEDWLSLTELIDSLPNDSEEIANGIRNWLKLDSRSQINEVFKNKRQEIPSSLNDDGQTLGAGGTKSTTPANQQSESSKELIQNAIKLNSPLSDDKKSPPKP